MHLALLKSAYPQTDVANDKLIFSNNDKAVKITKTIISQLILVKIYFN